MTLADNVTARDAALAADVARQQAYSRGYFQAVNEAARTMANTGVGAAARFLSEQSTDITESQRFKLGVVIEESAGRRNPVEVWTDAAEAVMHPEDFAHAFCNGPLVEDDDAVHIAYWREQAAKAPVWTAERNWED